MIRYIVLAISLTVAMIAATGMTGGADDPAHALVFVISFSVAVGIFLGGIFSDA